MAVLLFQFYGICYSYNFLALNFLRCCVLSGQIILVCQFLDLLWISRASFWSFLSLIFLMKFSYVVSCFCPYFISGNKSMLVYACDCSNETLNRAKEIVDASNIVSIQQRFKTFYSDFAFTGFPKWLFCDSCRLILPHKQKDCLSSGWLTVLKNF